MTAAAGANTPLSGAEGPLAPRVSGDRLGDLERSVAALEQSVKALATIGDVGGSNRPVGVVSALSSPTRGLWFPAGWRAGGDEQRTHQWKDLAAWVDWLIDAYRLPPRAWKAWWKTPGVCEELAALRAWHRELSDHIVPDLAAPDEPWDLGRLIDWHREEKRVRMELARSLVDWHESLWRTVSRIAGADHTPLMPRETEATPLTATRHDEEATERRREFDQWLSDQRSESG